MDDAKPGLIAAIKRRFPRGWKRAVKSVLSVHGRLAQRDRLWGRKIVLFHLGYAGQETYVGPIIDEVRRRDADLAIFVIVDRTFTTPSPELSVRLGVPEERILPWTWAAREALGEVDVLISPTQWLFEEPGASLCICIFHGLPTKGITFVPDYMKPFNVLFLLGPLQQDLYREFAAKNPETARWTQTFEIGYPKSDRLLSGGYSRNDILASLGLDSRKPTLLYAPAWDKGGALEMYGEEIVERLLEVDAQLLVKLHYMCYRPEAPDWTARLRRFEKFPNFRHLGNQPIDPYLAASDVMINDISSASFEFMMLDKPVVFIDCPDFFKETLGQTQYIHGGNEVARDIRMNAGRNAGIIVAEPAGLPDAVRRSLEFPTEFAGQRRQIREQLLYNPGRAATAAADTLLKLIQG